MSYTRGRPDIGNEFNFYTYAVTVSQSVETTHSI
jgi:hypothetical protein